MMINDTDEYILVEYTSGRLIQILFCFCYLLIESLIKRFINLYFVFALIFGCLNFVAKFN